MDEAIRTWAGRRRRGGAMTTSTVSYSYSTGTIHARIIYKYRTLASVGVFAGSSRKNLHSRPGMGTDGGTSSRGSYGSS